MIEIHQHRCQHDEPCPLPFWTKEQQRYRPGNGSMKDQVDERCVHVTVATARAGSNATNNNARDVGRCALEFQVEVSLLCSSGGNTLRNSANSNKSYTIFVTPAAMNNHPKVDTLRRYPASTGLAAAARLLGTDVMLAAAGRSDGETIAIT